ncbi:MAG: hypothetical protein LCH96_03220 [Actinobacteria bacterium]|nr:hypothetical protein [Actinomycetota bacterium]
MDVTDSTTRVRMMLADTAGADGATISAADGLLRTFHGDPSVNWPALYAEVTQRAAGVAPAGSPYWTQGRPLSVLAFWGSDARARLAADQNTPAATLALLAADPDQGVRQWAAAPRRPTVLAAPVPVPPVPGPAPRKGSRWLPAVLASLATAVVAGLIGAGLWSAGVQNGYTTTVVDQEAREATTHEELTGQYELKTLKRRVCGNNKDYLSCVNQHVTLYNTVCLSKDLNGLAKATCSDLKKFIHDVKVRYRRCGAGCRTRADANGLWGWAYLRTVPLVASVSNNDALPEITHDERCTFVLGPIKLGTCPR